MLQVPAQSDIREVEDTPREENDSSIFKAIGKVPAALADAMLTFVRFPVDALNMFKDSEK